MSLENFNELVEGEIKTKLEIFNRRYCMITVTKVAKEYLHLCCPLIRYTMEQ